VLPGQLVLAKRDKFGRWYVAPAALSIGGPEIDLGDGPGSTIGPPCREWAETFADPPLIPQALALESTSWRNDAFPGTIPEAASLIFHHTDAFPYTDPATTSATKWFYACPVDQIFQTTEFFSGTGTYYTVYWRFWCAIECVAVEDPPGEFHPGLKVWLGLHGWAPGPPFFEPDSSESTDGEDLGNPNGDFLTYMLPAPYNPLEAMYPWFPPYEFPSGTPKYWPDTMPGISVSYPFTSWRIRQVGPAFLLGGSFGATS
jgi:hypothetical protein